MAGAYLSWRQFYFVLLGLRFYFALSNSYIHPDEHFQTLEVLTNRIFNYSTNVPWEFSSKDPARSIGVLYLLYGPVLYAIKFLNLDFSPLQIWYILRLQNVILGWIITDMCIYRLLPTKPERIKGVYFTICSFVTLVHQSHLFSNSIETYLVILSVLIINNLRLSNETKEEDENHHWSLIWLGAIISVGTFNRVTFPAFIILPFWFVFQYLWSHKIKTFHLAIGFLLPTISLILVDSISFGKSLKEIASAPLNINSYIITPLNNLVYNSNYSNLSQHGIHPYYTHILVNLPQILGPGILFLLKTSYWKTTPFLSMASAILVLSVIPHQELRFLMPIVPLACCCFDLYSFSSKKEGDTKKSTWGSILMNSWYIFNASFAILMGVFHQGGVIPALDHFHAENFQSDPSHNTIQVWWRTYSPPTWILGYKENTLQAITLNDETFAEGYTLDSSKTNYLFDLMGSDEDKILNFLTELKATQNTSTIYLVTPVASFNKVFKNESLAFNETWSYTYHLDMDHLDFSDIESLRPGLGIYELL
ncbi:alpha 1,2 mannosyltransferase [Scheffersomyces xylosifermentans]|uniref:alpha 1,2 mannosyltransferase n=1 Tax=Scheffersomyces xylosifermentans TaxID=1304137 RepID=UPI00315C5FD5